MVYGVLPGVEQVVVCESNSKGRWLACTTAAAAVQRLVVAAAAIAASIPAGLQPTCSVAIFAPTCMNQRGEADCTCLHRMYAGCGHSPGIEKGSCSVLQLRIQYLQDF